MIEGACEFQESANLRTKKMSHIRALVFSSLLALSGCPSEPKEVYVPRTEPTVELIVRASAVKVSVGEPVVLYAERWNHGTWELVERRSLSTEQCWIRRPPERHEPEVADNIHWQPTPAEGARFNTDLRADRTREVIFHSPGTYTLQPSSAIWCNREKIAHGQPIKIVVQQAHD